MNGEQLQQTQEQRAAAELVKLMKAKGFEIRIRTEDTMVIADLVRNEQVYCSCESVTIPDALLALFEVTQKW